MQEQRFLTVNGAPECSRFLGGIDACIRMLEQEAASPTSPADVAGALLVKMADVLAALPEALTPEGSEQIVAAKDLSMLLTVARAARSGALVAQQKGGDGH